MSGTQTFALYDNVCLWLLRSSQKARAAMRRRFQLFKKLSGSTYHASVGRRQCYRRADRLHLGHRGITKARTRRFCLSPRFVLCNDSLFLRGDNEVSHVGALPQRLCLVAERCLDNEFNVLVLGHSYSLVRSRGHLQSPFRLLHFSAGCHFVALLTFGDGCRADLQSRFNSSKSQIEHLPVWVMWY